MKRGLIAIAAAAVLMRGAAAGGRRIKQDKPFFEKIDIFPMKGKNVHRIPSLVVSKGGVVLASAKGVCMHSGPAVVDYRTGRIFKFYRSAETSPRRVGSLRGWTAGPTGRRLALRTCRWNPSSERTKI